MSAAARYAVFGHPVKHSLSPQIHAGFARQCGVQMEYVAIDVTPGDFPGVLARFAGDGGAGANVTLPLKESAYALATSTSVRAQRAGAVNTLIRRDGQWHGDNTDGVGLVRDLTERHGLDLRGRRTLLLGAGGAARGVAPALLDAGQRSYDPLWRLPLWRPYLRYLGSHVADIANSGSRMAGSVTAALYLERFIPDNTRWAHVDTYAWNDHPRPGRPQGGEALGLRAVYALLKDGFMLNQGQKKESRAR